MAQNQSSRRLIVFSTLVVAVAACASIPARATTFNFSVFCKPAAVTVVENSKPAVVTCTISNTRTNSAFILELGQLMITNTIAVGGEAVDMVGKVSGTGCTNGQTLSIPKKGSSGSSCEEMLSIPGVDTSGKNDLSNPPGIWAVSLGVSSLVNVGATPNKETPIKITVTVTDPPKSAVPESSSVLLLTAGLGILGLWQAAGRRRAGVERA